MASQLRGGIVSIEEEMIGDSIFRRTIDRQGKITEMMDGAIIHEITVGDLWKGRPIDDAARAEMKQYEMVDVTHLGARERNYIPGRAITPLPSGDDREPPTWACAYCGSVHPVTVYYCSQCGAHRQR